MSDQEEREEESEHLSEEDDGSYESEVCYDTYLSPTGAEKKSILSFALELRNDSTFCDVAFLVKGTLFRAHRVIVGSWSRWLRALLSEGPEEEVVCLDMFTPDAFGSILDYMYGKPFLFGVDSAESYLKVLRRLEMQHLEQQCWQFLISAIDSTNCEKLHDLADVFDCPPLKLCAWRILQEAIPGYSTAPGNMFSDLTEAQQKQLTFQLKGNGLTGPCDTDADQFQQSTEGNGDEDDEVRDDAEEEMPKILENVEAGEDADDEERDSEFGEGNSSHSSNVTSGKPPPMHPKQLPPSATATEVVQCWAAHLQFVYRQCQPPSGTRGPKKESMRNLNRDRNRRRRNKRGDDGDAEGEAGAGGDPDNAAGAVDGDAEAGDGDRASSVGSIAIIYKKKNRAKGGGFSASSSGGGMVTPKDTVDWGEELSRFYMGIQMPNKLDELSPILASWKGKEDLMIESLMRKYKANIPPELDAHLHRLMKYVHGTELVGGGGGGEAFPAVYNR